MHSALDDRKAVEKAKHHRRWLTILPLFFLSEKKRNLTGFSDIKDEQRGFLL